MTSFTSAYDHHVNDNMTTVFPHYTNTVDTGHGHCSDYFSNISTLLTTTELHRMSNNVSRVVWVNTVIYIWCLKWQWQMFHKCLQPPCEWQYDYSLHSLHKHGGHWTRSSFRQFFSISMLLTTTELHRMSNNVSRVVWLNTVIDILCLKWQWHVSQVLTTTMWMTIRRQSALITQTRWTLDTVIVHTIYILACSVECIMMSRPCGLTKHCNRQLVSKCTVSG